MLVGTVLVILLILAVIFAPMGLTAVKARRGTLPGSRTLPRQPIRERRPFGRQPIDIGR